MKVIFNTETKIVNTSSFYQDDDYSYQLQPNEIFIPVESENYWKYANAEDRLGEYKQDKLLEFQNIYKDLIDQGFVSPDFNITLALGDYDRNMFSQLLVSLNNLGDIGQTVEEVEIADINSQIHTFSVLNLKILLAQYGVYYSQIWASHIKNQNRVKNETDPIKIIEMIWQ